jgi:hypothetical protein
MADLTSSILITRLLCAVTISIGAMACATQPPNYDLFLVPPQEFSDSIERMVLGPVVVEAGVEVPESVLVMFDSLIADRLGALGFSVIPSFVYGELWTRIVQESGGLFDPYTGERHERRFRDAVEQLKQELLARYEPDALVYPEIWAVQAENPYGLARWDGASQGASMMDASVTALSLIITIQDLDGNELFVNGGGIALAEQYIPELFRTVPATAAQVFEDLERVVQAVDLALGPLASSRPGG